MYQRHGRTPIPIDTLSLIRSGDERAFADLLQAEWAPLVAFLTRRLASGTGGGGVGAADAAEDAAQEAFVRLWELRDRWESGSARALVFRIGQNVVADMMRRERVRRVAVDRTPGPASTPSPADRLAASEVAGRFHAVLAELPERRREVFLLARRDGLSYGEIAEVMELSLQTVANHMSLALRIYGARWRIFSPDRRWPADPAKRRHP